VCVCTCAYYTYIHTQIGVIYLYGVYKTCARKRMIKTSVEDEQGDEGTRHV